MEDGKVISSELDICTMVNIAKKAEHTIDIPSPPKHKRVNLRDIKGSAVHNSLYKGRVTTRYWARLQFNGHKVSIGYFPYTEKGKQDAMEAYDEAVIEAAEEIIKEKLNFHDKWKITITQV